MAGRIFTAKPAAAGRLHLWCYTICCGMPTHVSLKDIVQRQKLLGYDYDMLQPAEAGSWKAPYTEDRIAFVRAFHEYAQSNPGGRPQLWSEWLKQQAQ